MQSYSKIVVLSAGIQVDIDGIATFQKGGTAFSFSVIGDTYELRLKAVARLFQEGACTEFVLVGGDVEIEENGIRTTLRDADGNPVSKAEVMKHRLTTHYNVPEHCITVLRSASNTQGNITLLLEHFKELGITNTSTIGLLTSFWHLPRALKISRHQDLSLTPLCAESIVYDEYFDEIHRFYEEYGFTKILGSFKEKDSEIKGMRDLESGSYSSRFG